MNASVLRLTVASMLAAVAFADPAAAQPVLVKVPDGTLMAPWNMNVEAVKELNVLGANGQKIGDVDKVIGTSPATPTALIVDFDDGAGFDDRHDVAIPLGAFTMANQGLLLTMSADQIAALPEWED